ncbi:hypothetical protein VTO42DRAFT_3494 [Malbranchea cinnamomea]
MTSSTPSRPPPTGGNEMVTKGKPEDLNTRFFRYFQKEITALQEQMDRLGNTAIVSGERSDALDHCLAGISRLSSEVKDASNYIPTYDQRIYAEAIKALQDKLAEIKDSIAPRPKFTFKTARKNPSAVSLADAEEIAAERRRDLPGYKPSNDSPVGSSGNGTPRDINTSGQKETHLDSGHANGSRSQETISSGVSPVTVSAQTGRHIVLPMSASHVTLPASVTSLQRCVVDMSVPTTNAQPFATLTIKDVSTSLLICGQVNGSAHITRVENSVVVVSCHQFRMHDCKNVDVYLSCSSKPIIEDCSNVRFSKLPKTYAIDPNTHSSSDLWSEVEDFKWLKSGPSPNWKLLDDPSTVSEDIWSKIASGVPGWSLDDILKAARVI